MLFVDCYLMLFVDCCLILFVDSFKSISFKNKLMILLTNANINTKINVKINDNCKNLIIKQSLWLRFSCERFVALLLDVENSFDFVFFDNYSINIFVFIIYKYVEYSIINEFFIIDRRFDDLIFVSLIDSF